MDEDVDIVDELRQWWKGPSDLLDLLKRAADEIERLRDSADCKP